MSPSLIFLYRVGRWGGAVSRDWVGDTRCQLSGRRCHHLSKLASVETPLPFWPVVSGPPKPSDVLHDIMPLVNKTVVCTYDWLSKDVLSDVLHTHIQKGTRRLLEVLNISVTLIGVIVSCVYAYVQTHQITYIKYVQVFVCQLYLS